MYNKFSIVAPTTPSSKTNTKNSKNCSTDNATNREKDGQCNTTINTTTSTCSTKTPKKRGRPRKQSNAQSTDSEMTIISTESIDPLIYNEHKKEFRETSSQTTGHEICMNCKLALSPNIKSHVHVGVNTNEEVYSEDCPTLNNQPPKVENITPKKKRSSISIRELLN